MARTRISIKPINSNKFELKLYEIAESGLKSYIDIIEKWLEEFYKVIPHHVISNPIAYTWMETSLITTPIYKWEILLLWDSYTYVNTITIKIKSNKHLHTIIINKNKMYYCYDGKVHIWVKPIKSTLSTCLLYILNKVKEVVEVVNIALELSSRKNEKVIVGPYKVSFCNFILNMY